ncbi:MAG: delta-pyrroline-5-carboxylate dehydrogenase [Burkholderiaceae bacterium]|nr:delta-pyrroline-5-carboxylate dehydrogenase [Burkholderiaceae bacterium]
MGRKFRVQRLPLPAPPASGTFVAPTVIDVDSVADVGREVFGPVLHVLRFRRAELGRLVDDINACGYGLTFGVHSRIDETIDFVTSRIRAGNLYVNRNMIGAVVGVQPFGGLALSGTGPKAGGPLLLHRLRRGVRTPPLPTGAGTTLPPALLSLQAWFDASGRRELAGRCAALASSTALRQGLDLPGPTGESNRLRFIARARSPPRWPPATASRCLRRMARRWWRNCPGRSGSRSSWLAASARRAPTSCCASRPGRRPRVARSPRATDRACGW